MKWEKFKKINKLKTWRFLLSHIRPYVSLCVLSWISRVRTMPYEEQPLHCETDFFCYISSRVTGNALLIVLVCFNICACDHKIVVWEWAAVLNSDFFFPLHIQISINVFCRMCARLSVYQVSVKHHNVQAALWFMSLQSFSYSFYLFLKCFLLHADYLIIQCCSV